MKTTHRVLSGRDGFTLIELLVVIAIVGILAQIVVPPMGGVLRSWRSKQAADQIAADFSYARSLAVRSGAGSRLVFVSDQQYRIEEGSGAGAVVKKSVDLSREYGPVRLLPADGAAELVFNARGMALTGAGVFVVESESAGSVRRDSLWVSVLGMVRREG